MKINADLIVGGFTAALALLTYVVTRDVSRLGIIFVNYVLVIMGVLSAVILMKGFIKPERLKFFDSAVERNNVVMGVAILLLYLIFLPLAGFLPSSYVFYFVFNTYLTGEDRFATRNLIQSAIISFLVVTAFYLIFHNFLEVPLPKGRWFDS
ncbi:MAG: tripartite tricarboxylate transporter TctB family protein [Desulfobacterales bacterium]